MRFPSLLFLSASLAFSAPDTVDTTFATSGGLVFQSSSSRFFSPSAKIKCSIVQPNGQVVFGGDLMEGRVDGTLYNLPLIRFNSDGSTDTIFGAGRSQFGELKGIVTSSRTPEVKALALQSGGKLIAAGNFNGYGFGSNSIVITHGGEGIVRFNVDGAPDPTFQTMGVYTPSQSGPRRANLEIKDVEVSSDEKIWCGGDFKGFTEVDGTQVIREGIARLNPDGSVDQSFGLSPSDFLNDLELSFLGAVTCEAIELAPGGGAYVVVRFIPRGFRASGFGRGFRAHAARLNPDGSRDHSFQPDLPSISGFQPESLVVDESSRLVVIGSESPYMVRFHPDGLLDTTFQLDPSLKFVGNNKVAATQDGQYYLPTCTPIGIGSLSRINDDGSLDSTFQAIAGPFTDAFTSQDLSRKLIATLGNPAVSPDGSVYSGAFFEVVNGVTSRNVVKFEGDTAPGAVGVISVLSSAARSRETSESTSIGVRRRGGISGSASVQYSTAEGSATDSADFTPTSGVLTWENGEGGIKYITISLINDSVSEGGESFLVSLSSASGSDLGSSTTEVSIIDDDSAPTILRHPVDQSVRLSETATFSVVPNSPYPVTYQWQRDGIEIPEATESSYSLAFPSVVDVGAIFQVTVSNANGSVDSSPATLAEVLVVDGVLDPSFVIQDVSSGKTMAVLPDDSVVIDQQDDQIFRMKRILSNGTLDSTFETPVFSFTVGLASAEEVVITPDGKIYISGRFDAVGGIATNSKLVRLNADGSLDTTFNFSATDQPSDLFIDSDGNLYCEFEVADDGNALRRLFSDGSIDDNFSFPVDERGFGRVESIDQDAEGKLVIVTFQAEDFFFDGSAFIHRVFLASGEPDPSFTRVETPRLIEHVIVLRDGRIAVAGSGLLALFDSSGIIEEKFANSLSTVKGLVESKGHLIVSTVTSLFRISLDGRIDSDFEEVIRAQDVSFQLHIDSLGRLLARPDGSFLSISQIRGIGRILLPDPFVGFVRREMEISEGAGEVVLSVDRYGDADQPMSVRVSTESATATSPADFIEVSEMLTWSAGDSTSRLVTIPVVDQNTSGSDRSFSVVLSEVTGAVIINPAVEVMILDDEPLPRLIAQPQDVEAILGGAASLSIEVSGSESVAVQWFKDGSILEGENEAILVFSDVSAADEGSYSAEVTNEFGTISTSSGMLALVLNPSENVSGFGGVAATLVDPFTVLETSSDGGAFVGGNNAGMDASSPILKLKGDGSVDMSFNPPAFVGRIHDLVVELSGSVIIVGHFFFSEGEVDVRRIARLLPDGSLDAVFTSRIGSGPDINGDPSGTTLETIDRFPDGRLVVAGRFSLWNGKDRGERRNLVLLAEDGSELPFVGGGTETFSDIRVGPDGFIYGVLDHSKSTPKLVSYDQEGNTVEEFSFFGNQVKSINFTQNGSLLLALASPITEEFVTGSFVRFSPNGLLEKIIPFENHAGVSANFLVEQIDGKYIAGYSGEEGGRSALARFFPDGSLDPIFDVDFSGNARVDHLALRADGSLWIGGDFDSVNGLPTQNVALLNAKVVSDSSVSSFASFIANSGLPDSQQGRLDDPDGDYFTNEVEYLLGGDPATFNQGLITQSEIVGADLSRYFVITFSIDNDVDDLDWSVKASENLADFQVEALLESSIDNGVSTTYQYRLPWPLDDSRGRGFLRFETNSD